MYVLSIMKQDHDGLLHMRKCVMFVNACFYRARSPHNNVYEVRVASAGALTTSPTSVDAAFVMPAPVN